MGSATSQPPLPRVLLSTNAQLFLKERPLAEAATTVQRWFQEGAPLGLSCACFAEVFGLENHEELAALLFNIFDTDNNRKVDAFEALSAALLLADGPLEDKVDKLFPVFDFSGEGRMNFDEANILLQSAHRGLRKAMGTPDEYDEEDDMEVCQQLFDAFNVTYDNQVTREQLRRWLRSDDEASAFLDLCHNAASLKAIERTLEEKEMAQAQIFTQFCASGTSIPAEALIGSSSFYEALGGARPAEALGFVQAMTNGTGTGPIQLAVYAQAARAWNIFNALDTERTGELLVATDLTTLLWLLFREQPSEGQFSRWRDALGHAEGQLVARLDFVSASISVS
eukprot:NODE_5079_length_1810_cov_10.382056.p2 GENE.NODE_5079_length_1810_cov_10.382056~~NODE_5079_length_1810_cov_10.382056.p2  ORF type:complete len:360 (-),score=146.97 NODE_5079_length_1810_cov_10.382056:730-1746(-)